MQSIELVDALNPTHVLATTALPWNKLCDASASQVVLETPDLLEACGSPRVVWRELPMYLRTEPYQIRTCPLFLQKQQTLSVSWDRPMRTVSFSTAMSKHKHDTCSSLNIVSLLCPKHETLKQQQCCLVPKTLSNITWIPESSVTKAVQNRPPLFVPSTLLTILCFNITFETRQLSLYWNQTLHNRSPNALEVMHKVMSNVWPKKQERQEHLHQHIVFFKGSSAPLTHPLPAGNWELVLQRHYICTVDKKRLWSLVEKDEHLRRLAVLQKEIQRITERSKQNQPFATPCYQRSLQLVQPDKKEAVFHTVWETSNNTKELEIYEKCSHRPPPLNITPKTYQESKSKETTAIDKHAQSLQARIFLVAQPEGFIRQSNPQARAQRSRRDTRSKQQEQQEQGLALPSAELNTIVSAEGSATLFQRLKKFLDHRQDWFLDWRQVVWGYATHATDAKHAKHTWKVLSFTPVCIKSLEEILSKTKTIDIQPCVPLAFETRRTTRLMPITTRPCDLSLPKGHVIRPQSTFQALSDTDHLFYVKSDILREETLSTLYQSLIHKQSKKTGYFLNTTPLPRLVQWLRMMNKKTVPTGPILPICNSYLVSIRADQYNNMTLSQWKDQVVKLKANCEQIQLELMSADLFQDETGHVLFAPLALSKHYAKTKKRKKIEEDKEKEKEKPQTKIVHIGELVEIIFIVHHTLCTLFFLSLSA